jgi:secretion/DNA translocation related TadE-like protein
VTRDSGSMTILGIGVLAAALAMGFALAALVGFLTDRAQARAAADLAAIAGALAVREGLDGDGPDPCAVAAEAATANSALLISCHALGDGSIQVTVASGRAKATARAGPQWGAGQGPGGGSG